MVKKAFISGTLFTGEHVFFDHTLYCENGIIIDISDKKPSVSYQGEIIDLKNLRIAPGFIDIQVNGGGGILFNQDISLSGIQAIVKAHQKYGTVGLLPTLISDSHTKIEEAIKVTEQAIKRGMTGVLGVHLEGPFLNKLRKGAHDSNYFSRLSIDHVDMLSSLNEGVTLLTIAPEQSDPLVIKLLADKNVIVFAGHTAASYEQVTEAIAHGLKGFTHLFNAMTPMHSRDPGVVGAALEDKHCWCGFIVDGFHVHKATLKVAMAAKKAGKAILVTDAMPTVGTGNNKFLLNNEWIYVEDGRCFNQEGALAGSNLDMMTSVRNTVDWLDIDWKEAIRMASTYPAECLGVDDKYGYLKPGYKASFVVIDEYLMLDSVWIESERVP